MNVKDVSGENLADNALPGDAERIGGEDAMPEPAQSEHDKDEHGGHRPSADERIGIHQQPLGRARQKVHVAVLQQLPTCRNLGGFSRSPLTTADDVAFS